MRTVTPEPLVRGEDTFADVRFGARDPSVVLVLDSLDTDRIFAGVKTALLAGLLAAERLGRRLRVVPLRRSAPAEHLAARLREWVEHNTPQTLHGCEMSVVGQPVSAELFHRQDVWIVTYWSTAHALSAACQRGVVSPKQVIYLIQDYEPGFFAWGSDYALASETYRQGFHPLVNSRPLADALVRQAGVSIDQDTIFAPDVDMPRLHQAARAWRPGERGEVRVLFYARPSKPRNMFSLGVAALLRWAQGLPDGIRPVISSAGEDHVPVDLGRGILVRPLGKLPLQAYYDLLSRVDVGLALMHSPHPGHLSLELPMSGIATVTNTLDDFRTAWVGGLILATPTPTPAALASALGEACFRSRSLARHTPASPWIDLGGSLDTALDKILGRLSW